MLRSAEDCFEVWDEFGANKIETYTHGRDDDGELLNDSVEEEFSLTLGPPVLLAAQQKRQSELIEKKRDECDEPHVNVAATVATFMKGVVANVFSRCEDAQQLDKPEEPPVQNEQPVPLLTPAEDLTAKEPDPVFTPVVVEQTRYLLKSRPVYVWSVTDNNVGFVFDEADASWASIPRAAFESAATAVSTDPKGAVHGVIMQRLSPRGARVPAATLRDRHAPPGLDPNRWQIYGQYVPGQAGTNFAMKGLVAKHKLTAGMGVKCTP
eukprot:312452-Pleurochrysis_carterae.AAC.1